MCLDVWGGGAAGYTLAIHLGLCWHSRPSFPMRWKSLLEPREGLAEADLDAFESEACALLPSAYRELLCESNGGRVKVEHEFLLDIDGVKTEMGVDSFFPLLPNGSHLSVAESMGIWRRCGIVLDSFIPIGDDSGVGYYFLELDTGSVFYLYQDDVVPGTSLASMIYADKSRWFVAGSLDSLRELIVSGIGKGEEEE